MSPSLSFPFPNSLQIIVIPHQGKIISGESSTHTYMLTYHSRPPFKENAFSALYLSPILGAPEFVVPSRFSVFHYMHSGADS